ncbi:MAG: hypothetical protein JO085_00940 [Acidimicrobiia bacterium]|nr:hypothetical protein [Acidimicrobiia bacterium]
MVEVGALVEVRCHATCPWTGGWQVAEVVIGGGGGFAYRVRRIGLTQPLGAPIPGDDVRPARIPALGRAG